ncbi:MAG: tetratricopeptide repeat protein [Cyanobacteria bacterium REEB459]|nr:tetratricopeptide repeat protein [Cyanobacteria bacterium REEB459]
MEPYLSPALRSTLILAQQSTISEAGEASACSLRDQQYLNDEAQQWLHQGIDYFRQGRFPPALALIQQSLLAYQRLSNQPLVARVLLALSALYYRLADYLWAVDYGRQCLRVAQGLQDPVLLQEVLDHLGNSYRHLGDLSQALDYMQQSLDLAYQIKDQPATMRALNNLAMIYRARGENHQAAQLYQASLVIAQETEQLTVQLHILQNLGNTYRSLQHYSQAIRCYESFLKLQQAQTQNSDRGAGAIDNHTVRRILNHLTTLTLAVHDYNRAIVHLQHHLTIACALGDNRCAAKLVDTLHQCYAALNQARGFRSPLLPIEASLPAETLPIKDRMYTLENPIHSSSR